MYVAFWPFACRICSKKYIYHENKVLSIETQKEGKRRKDAPSHCRPPSDTGSGRRSRTPGPGPWIPATAGEEDSGGYPVEAFEATSTVLRDLDFRIVLEADRAPQNGGKLAIMAD